MNKIEVKLECSCKTRISILSNNARLGSTLYCRFHGYQIVNTIYPQEWRVVCPACTYGRWAGQNHLRAGLLAREHKHDAFIVYDYVTGSGGTPRIELIKNRERELHNSQDCGTLFEDAEEPPF